MCNILKMDMYRMLKSRITLLCLLGTVAMVAFSVCMTSYDVHYYMAHPDEFQKVEIIEDGGEDWGIYIGSVMPSWCRGEKVPYANLLENNIQSKMVLLFFVVFMVGFVSAEQKCRFVQNISGQVSDRGQIMVSKIAVAAVYAMLQMVCICAVIGMASKLLFGYLNMEHSGRLLLVLGLQIFLQIAFGALVILIITITRSTIASMIIGILLSSGMIQVLDPFIKMVFHVKKSFSIMYYTLSGNIGMIHSGSSRQNLERAFVIAFAVLAVTGYVSGWIARIRDVE